MRIGAAEVPRVAAKELPPAWLIAADEPLLAIEAADSVRTEARKQGYTEREVLFIDQRSDWTKLAGAGHSGSLFATRQLLEWRVATEVGKPGSDAIAQWLEHFPPDTCLLVILPGRDPVKRRTKWVSAFEQKGVVVDIKPIYDNQFGAWLKTRLRQRGLEISAEALHRLSYRLEGNLLAAAQEIERLSLWCDGRVEVDEVEELVGDSARFDPFQLTDRALSGDAGATVRVLRGLRAEGAPPPRVVWLIHRELSHLLALSGKGRAAASEYGRQQRLWPARLDMLMRATRRFTRPDLLTMMQHCQRLDAMSKGRADGDVWATAERLLLSIAGRLPLAGVA